MIDTNVYVFRWPFRRLPAETGEGLREKFVATGVSAAWVGSWEGVFHRDLAGVNRRLAEECRGETAVRLLAFGSVNPLLPNWPADLEACQRVHGMSGIRLHPSYHGYSLDLPQLAKLLQDAADRNLLVQLAAALEDERNQPVLGRVPPLAWEPLFELVRQIAGLRLVLLNCFRTLSLEQAERLAALGQVYFEISTLEGVGRVAELVERVGQDRVLFGSFFPMFYWEAARLKLAEASLPGLLQDAIQRQNAGLLCPSP